MSSCRRRSLLIERLETRQVLAAVGFAPPLMIFRDTLNDVANYTAEAWNDDAWADVVVSHMDEIRIYQTVTGLDGDAQGLAADQYVRLENPYPDRSNLDRRTVHRLPSVDGRLRMLTSPGSGSAAFDIITVGNESQPVRIDASIPFPSTPPPDSAADHRVSSLLADLDQDGDEDLAAWGTWGPNVHDPAMRFLGVYENVDGAFDFRLRWQSNTDLILDTVRPLDWDGDGDLDLVGSGYDLARNHRGVYQMEFVGWGPLRERSELIVLPNSGAALLEVADLNQDQSLDLITRQSGSLVVHYGGPTGFQPIVLGAMDVAAQDLVQVTDWDRDGDLDLVAIRNRGVAGPSELYWFENREAIGFAPASLIYRSPGLADLQFVDFDSDGDVDVFAFHGVNLEWLEHLPAPDPTGVWLRARSLTGRIANQWESELADVVPLDADGDGTDELLLVHRLEAEQTAWLELRQFDPVQESTTHLTLVNRLGADLTIRLDDVDHDRDLDLLVHDRQSKTLIWLENPQQRVPWPAHALGTANDAVFVDWEADHDLDLVAYDGNAFALGTNDAGQFRWRSLGTGPTVFRQFAAGDLDADGAMDLLTLHDDRLVWSRQDPSGMLEAPQTLRELLPDNTRLFAADLAGDPAAEIVLSSYDPDTSRDQTTFNEILQWDSATHQLQLLDRFPGHDPEWFDLEGDGRLDALVNRLRYFNSSYGLDLHLNQDGNFATKRVLSQWHTYGAVPMIVNHQILPDLLLRHQYGISWWRRDVDSTDLDGDTETADVDDIDQLCRYVRDAGPAVLADFNDDGLVDLRDWEAFLARLGIGPGDANFDGNFTSSDLVVAFNIGQYEQLPSETGRRESWAGGDWNCDGTFNSSDLVRAFGRGYENFAGSAPQFNWAVAAAAVAPPVRKPKAYLS